MPPYFIIRGRASLAPWWWPLAAAGDPELAVASECVGLRNAAAQLVFSALLGSRRVEVEYLVAFDSLLEEVHGAGETSFYRGVLENAFYHYWPGHALRGRPPLAPLQYSAMMACVLAVLLARRMKQGAPWVALDQARGLAALEGGPWEVLEALSRPGWSREDSRLLMAALLSLIHI